MPHAALRVFLSPPDFLGFGSVDYLLGSIGGLLCLALVAFRCHVPRTGQPSRVLNGPVFTALTIGITGLPGILRLCLLGQHPVPIGSGADDWSYLLLADTLAHGRLANPPHRFPDFFEQIFVLQTPTHSSIYPLGQGLLLAAGQWLFGSPWVGVLATSAIFIASLIWALRVFVGDRWALWGGLVAVAQFGPLCYWMNCYWGGYLSAAAGCLVFGSLGRLAQSNRLLHVVPLGLGLALQLLTRPFEFLLLSVCVAGFLGHLLLRAHPFRTRWRPACLLLLGTLTPAMLLMMLQNTRVTGNPWTLPYGAYRHQYGIPATFTFQHNPVPTRLLNEEQQQDYAAECAIHGEERDTPSLYAERGLERIRFLRFFLPPAWYGLFLLGLFLPIRRQLILPFGSLAIFLVGSNFYPYFYPHYVAAVTPLVLLIPMTIMKAVVEEQPTARRTLTRLLIAALVTSTLGPFVFWYAVRLQTPGRTRDRLLSFETWNFLNGPDPQGRATVAKRLSAFPGKQLVFVQYSPGHAFAEWIHNEASIDEAQTIYVHDKGISANEQLQAHYPERKAWLLQPDFGPPRLTQLPASTSPFENVP